MRFPVLSFLALSVAVGGSAIAAPSPAQQDLEARPLLKKYCYECHGEGASSGDLELDKFKSLADVRKSKDQWGKVIRYVQAGTMPAADAEKHPTQADRDAMVRSLTLQVYDVDPKNPDPGPQVVRRLNRTEYLNTVRDLTGIRSDPTQDFPQDDTGYGFDNIGDVLTVPPMLMEKYLRAADRVLDEAIPTRAASGNGGEHGRKEEGGERKMTDTMRKLFERHRAPTTRSADGDPSAARAVLADFARRAWRRPVKPDEVDRLVKLYTLARSADETFAGGIKHAMKGVLVSPSFLFRGEIYAEPGRGAGGGMRQVGEFELASRLSYFLWSSCPDDELLDLAEKKRLRINLDAQVKRMLASSRSKEFVENFAGQWLQFRNLDAAHPDPKLFKAYDDDVREDMQRETQTFFESILREDRNPIEILTADYTFVNARLARLYGIGGVDSKEFKRVSLAGTPRRGVLTQGSVLTLTSNPTRTSPVKRGKWVLENLLGASPPAPPPNLPTLENPEGGHDATGTLRQRMEKHRAKAECASCHAPMDPIGFGLENFDAIGRWREKDGDGPIDPASSFADGTKFSGAVELTALLAKTRRDDFCRAITEAAMTYALGRGVEPYDLPAVEKVVAELRKPDAKFSGLIYGIINSTPFQMRRGDLFVGRSAGDNSKMD